MSIYKYVYMSIYDNELFKYTHLSRRSRGAWLATEQLFIGAYHHILFYFKIIKNDKNDVNVTEITRWQEVLFKSLDGEFRAIDVFSRTNDALKVTK